MKKTFGAPVLIVTAIVATLTAREKASTQRPDFSAKGAWASCELISDSRQDGDNQQDTVTITQKFIGTLDGKWEGSEREVVHKDGTRTFSGSGTFTGEINGHAGTAVLTHSGTVDSKGVAVAHWILDHGTDDLARVDGQGTWEGTRTRPAPAECRELRSQSAWSGNYVGTVTLPELKNAEHPTPNPEN